MNAIHIGLIATMSLASTTLAEQSAVNLLPGIATAQSSSNAEASSSWADNLYFTTDVGINWMPNVGIKDLNFALTGINIFQITNVDVSMDQGVRWDIGIGYEFNDNFRVQLETGILSNSIDRFSGTVVDDLGFISGVPGDSANFTDSNTSGRIKQVPIMFAGIYEFDLGHGDRTDKGAMAGWRFSPYIGGGIGTVYIDSDANLENNSLGLGGNDWVFGYQFMAGLEYEISDNWFISVSYRFLGLTEATLDEIKIDGVPLSQTSLLLDKNYVKTEAVYNHSLQFGLRIEF